MASAEQKLARMRGSLKRWLVFRAKRDKGVSQAMAPVVRQERYNAEQDLASRLYTVLSEMGADPGCLASPDVARDPQAAVELAKVAISGGCQKSNGLGLVWFALAIPIGGAVLLASQYISSKAEEAELKERYACIRDGNCTDTGFWLKMASIAVIGWLAWDKMGLREAVNKKR